MIVWIEVNLAIVVAEGATGVFVHNQIIVNHVDHTVHPILPFVPAEQDVYEVVVGVIYAAGQDEHIGAGYLKARIHPSPIIAFSVDGGQDVVGNAHGEVQRHFDRILGKRGSRNEGQQKGNQ